MCVIMCFEDNFPTKEILENAEKMNEHGGGMAWIEDDEVHYKKGVKTKEILQTIKERKMKLPIIIHYRIATVGNICKELTHPFPIEADAPLNVEGKSKNGVLFHNGNWNDWRNLCIQTVTRKQIKMPRGIWSDSRAMAFLAFHYDIGFLNFIPANKIAVLTPKGIERFGSNWVNVDNVLCSNDTFDNSTNNTYYPNTRTGYTQYFDQQEGKWKRIDDSSDGQVISSAVEDAIEEQLKQATEKELKKDVETADQIMRNRIRQDLNKKVNEISKSAVSNVTKTEREKDKDDSLTLEEYIKKYDGVDDKVIMEEFYKHSKFRQKHEHDEEEVEQTNRRVPRNNKSASGLTKPIQQFFGVA